jgi:hypothetical protein
MLLVRDRLRGVAVDGCRVTRFWSELILCSRDDP